jgi:hypothetical protein
MRRFVRVVALALAPGAATLGAQSLGEMAQKEKQKREAATRAGEAGPAEQKPRDKKVYTTSDLESYAATREAEAPEGEGESAKEPSETAATSGGPSTPSRPGGRSPMGIADDSAERAVQEQTWRGRAAAARAAIVAAEAALKEAEAQRGRLGPGPPPYQSHQAWARSANAADARLAGAQKALEAAKKNLEQLEEDARRAGIPAGWVR